MRKCGLIAAAAAAGLAMSGSLARADFQFNLIFNVLPSGSGPLTGDDQWVVQVKNDGTNNTGNNLLGAALTMLAVNSNGTVNKNGVFFIRTFNPTTGAYDNVTPANNNAADFSNQAASGRPGPAGSYVNFGGAQWVAGSQPTGTDKTYTDYQAVGWSASVPNVSPQAQGLGGNFSVVGLANPPAGVVDTAFATLAQAIVPHGEIPVFDVQLGGEGTGNTTSKLLVGLVGDTDYSGKVDFQDFSTLAARFGKSGNFGWAGGDFNGDGVINFNDFSALAANFNKSIPTITPGAIAALLPAVNAVPEPSSLFGIFGATAAMLLRRRRRSV